MLKTREHDRLVEMRVNDIITWQLAHASKMIGLITMAQNGIKAFETGTYWGKLSYVIDRLPQ